MTDWDADDLAALGRAASDVTALGLTIELLRRRDPDDPAILRARHLVAQLHETLVLLIERLRG